MTMDPEARYAWVGAAVLTLFALVIAGFLWLVGSSQHRDERTYRIYFARQSLEGLQARSDVRMKGIRVGEVTAFSFSSRRPGTVEVSVSLDPAAPVRESTLAVVDRNLITGLATIRLVNTREDSPLLRTVAPGEHDLVIAEGASRLQEVSDSLEQLAARADETMRRIDAVLSDRNQEAIAATLANLSVLSGHADETMQRLDRTLSSVGRAADGLAAFESRVAGDADALTSRYDALGVQATASLRDITESVHHMSNDLSVVADRAQVSLADGDANLRVTARQVEMSAQSLGEAARRLRDPRAAFFGPPAAALGPGEEAR
jgi:phospholipid/cholesterol/gamma-HCH transport system substrate-binding protein